MSIRSVIHVLMTVCALMLAWPVQAGEVRADPPTVQCDCPKKGSKCDCPKCKKGKPCDCPKCKEGKPCDCPRCKEGKPCDCPKKKGK